MATERSMGAYSTDDVLTDGIWRPALRMVGGWMHTVWFWLLELTVLTFLPYFTPGIRAKLPGDSWLATRSAFWFDLTVFGFLLSQLST